MTRASFLAILLLLVARGTAAGSQSPVPSPAPPVLSTVPSPAAGMMPEPSQMSGLPLQVGDLPPGVVVIRVIQQTFQNNVANQAVLLRAGATGRVLSAVTGPDGRARFEGIAVGERVQVRTAVGAETLESQHFEIPSQAGVRVVLAAGVGAGTPAAIPWPAPTGGDTTASSPTGASTPDGESASGSTWRRAGIVVGLLLVGTSVLAWLGLPWIERRRGSAGLASVPPVNSPLAEAPPLALAVEGLRARRAGLFETLVQLEKDHAAGRVADDVHGERHEALVAELVVLDGQIEAGAGTLDRDTQG